MSLRERFPRLYRLETDKESVISARGSWENERWVWRWCWGREVRGRSIGELERLLMLMQNISPNINCRDSWKWKLDSNGSFSVKALRMILEIKLYEPNRCIEETLWNHLVPKKISIFVWRLMQLKLPVREALDHRGIELHSTLCPRCELDIETHDHCFINCPFALQVWERIFKWWTWDKFNPIQISELTKHPGHGIFSQFHNLVWQATIWTTCYIIWGRRNEKVFSGKNSDINNVVSLIQAHVFERISIKRKSGSLMWNSWVENPVEAINLMAASTGPVESVPKGQAI